MPHVELVVAIRDLSDEQLAAEAAREGSDGPAFVALVERFQDRVWRVCYRLMGNAEDASDATQEVFVRLFLQRAQFEGRSKYSTWMHGIAIRTCLMMRRGRGRRKKHEEVAQRHGNERQERSHREESKRPRRNPFDAVAFVNGYEIHLDEGVRP